MVTGLAAVLLVIALLLVVVSAVQPLARMLELSETVLLAIVGIIIGSLADFGLRTSYVSVFGGIAETLLDFPVNSEAFLLIFLPVLVFQCSLAIDVRRLIHEIATVLLMAVVAVVVSTAMIGFTLFPFAQMSLVVCLLLGAIVATTDPSAVAGIFRDIGAASRLTRLIEGESLLNDAAAISIFSLLLPSITAHRHLHLGEAIISFFVSFIGAFIVGIVVGRITLWIMSIIRSSAAEITLSVALPYIVYIICDEFLDLSGVVATVASGLTLSFYGPSTIRLQTWLFLQQLWQQIVFWAGSLVFVLTSMLIPHLLMGVTAWDCVLIFVASLAGMAARAVVVFGLLPFLTLFRLSPSVPVPFKITMVWGGLRGAITLALALAVTENDNVPTPVAHFVGIVATGFVLITLLVNGTTLRSLVLFLKLDHLPSIDEAMRHQILGIGLSNVHDRAQEVAERLNFHQEVTQPILDQMQRRSNEEKEVNEFDKAITDTQRISLALIAIASQERSLLMDLFRMQGLSRRMIEVLLRSAESAIDGARLDGRLGYVRAMRRRLSPSFRFKVAQWFHSYLNLEHPLMLCMAERFEMLMVARFVSTSLMRFMHERLSPTLGSRVGEIVEEVLLRQSKLLDDALATLRFHYRGYAEALESRIFYQIVLRLEGEEYNTLLAESLISDELNRDLFKDLDRRSQRAERRLSFDLRSGIDDHINAAAVFKGVPRAELHDLAMTTTLRFAAPQEIISRKGKRMRYVYFISAGEVEVHVSGVDRVYKEGDLLGVHEVLDNQPCAGTIRAVRFGHFMAIKVSRFRRLIEDYPIVIENIKAARKDETPKTSETEETSSSTLFLQHEKSDEKPNEKPNKLVEEGKNTALLTHHKDTTDDIHDDSNNKNP